MPNNENNKIVNGGSVRLAFVEMASNKTVTAPAFLVEKLKEFF